MLFPEITARVSKMQMKPISTFNNEDNVDVNVLVDRIRAMLQQEKHYSAMNYFFFSHYDIGSILPSTSMAVSNNNLQHNLTELGVDVQCRLKMCQWCYQVVEYFKFNRETVQIGMSYFDRFLSTPQGRPYLQDRSNFQLACITCLYVAIKVHEPIELDMSLLCELSRGSYTVSQISRTEMIILEALQWRLNPPTTTAFVQHIVALLASSCTTYVLRSLMDAAVHQTEIANINASIILNNKPSVVAFAAVLNAFDSIGVSAGSFVSSIHDLTGTASDIECIQSCQTQLQRAACVQKEPKNFSSTKNPLKDSPIIGKATISKIKEMEKEQLVGVFADHCIWYSSCIRSLFKKLSL